MRTPAEAARDAVSGFDDTLWTACWERMTGSECRQALAAHTGDRVDMFLGVIRSMSPAELKLYDISPEAEK